MAGQAKKDALPSAATGYAIGFIVLCTVVYILNIAAQVMVPLFIAVMIWYLINAIARGLSGLGAYGVRIPRFVCFLFAILLLLAGLWAMFALIRQNAAHVIAAAPVYQANFQAIWPKLVGLLGLQYVPTAGEIVQYINLPNIIRPLVTTFTGIAGKTLEVLFFTGFLLYEQRFFNRKIAEMIENQRFEDKFRHILHNIDIKMQHYIAVKALVSLLAGAVTYLILRLAGMNFAAFWGLMAFFLHFIPYVGTVAAIGLPSLMALVQFGDVGMFLSVALTLSVALMLIGHILDTRLLGDRLNLSPICILVSIAMWGMIWGVPGMFLSVPILAIIVISMSQFDKTRPFAILLSKDGRVEKQHRKSA
jgi:AI-2 transport protein TqsA